MLIYCTAVRHEFQMNNIEKMLLLKIQIATSNTVGSYKGLR